MVGTSGGYYLLVTKFGTDKIFDKIMEYKMKGPSIIAKKKDEGKKIVFVYYRLSRREESDMIEMFGEEYKRYMERTPMFIPNIFSKKEVIA